MRRITFTVDSALLRELGERLVGRPHIALAELIKNSYDADATGVIVRFAEDSLAVIDNGHGMTFEDFRDHWMRIGTAHKQSERMSRRFHRSVTGSKGIGRLAVQFLAQELEMRTVSEEDPETEVHVTVNWGEAIAAGELTQATARYEFRAATPLIGPDRSPGTEIVLHRLNQEWGPDDFEALAREIWALQPPYPGVGKQSAFQVTLEAPGEPPDIVQRFEEQMQAVLRLWYARLRGRIVGSGRNRVVELAVEFNDGQVEQVRYPVEHVGVGRASFDIRVFDLHHRQPYGIKVDQARDYLRRYGGVQVYDAGFHLPYYGVDTDWLNVERDHANRLSASDLLPQDLQVTGGLLQLPTNRRIFGVVHVETAHGAMRGEDVLQIQLTRDRLVDNRAFAELRRIVRWALDYYAMVQARRRFTDLEKRRPREDLPAKASRVSEVLEKHRSEISGPAYSALGREIREVVSATETEAERVARQSGLLGGLATAGMVALGYEHEAAKQYRLLERHVRRLRRIARQCELPEVDSIASELESWLQAARGTRRLFSHLLDRESSEDVARLRVEQVVRSVVDQSRSLLRGVEIDTAAIDGKVLFPPASYSDWAAILQNVLLNAANALLDSPQKLVGMMTTGESRQSALVVQDTGSGVDLGTADQLFEPFVRRSEISAERRSLGLGGSGLGLTIVRVIAANRGCEVQFVAPRPPFQTALELSWREP